LLYICNYFGKTPFIVQTDVAVDQLVEQKPEEQCQQSKIMRI